MNNNKGGAVPVQPQAIPVVGQRWIEDVPLEYRKGPEGAAVYIVALIRADKEQLNRIEEKLDCLLAVNGKPEA